MAVGRGGNATGISDAVCQVLIDARVDLVLVDEILNLNLATSAGEDMSDHLRYFTKHLPATFVYAGINVERFGLFTGVRGKQIARIRPAAHRQQPEHRRCLQIRALEATSPQRS